MITFKTVSFKYINELNDNQQSVLKNVSFNVKSGECVGLIGKSGCGKSTILKLINGIIPHLFEGDIKGEIMVDGQNPSQHSIQEISKGVGSVFQNPKSQFFHLNTTDEVIFGAVNHCVPKAEILDRLKVTTRVFSIEDLLNRDIFKLSGGEKQRIACASVYTHQPKIFLMDEPSSNLDAKGIKALSEVISVLKGQGHTILIAEHRLYYLIEHCDRFLYFDQGQLKHSFTVQELSDLSQEKQRELGLRTLIKPQLKLLKASHPHPALTLENLSVHCKRKKVLDIASTVFYQHAVTAIVGDNGAGKSTLAKALCGLIKSSGVILDNGKALSKKMRNKKFFMVMQDVNHQLFSESVLEELLMGDVSEQSSQRALEILDALDLTEFKNLHPLALSGGQKQRVAIASAIFSGCDYLIFDEPTSGLDYAHMLKFAKLIQRIKTEVKSVLIITHDIELIDACCDCVYKIEKPIY